MNSRAFLFSRRNKSNHISNRRSRLELLKLTFLFSGIILITFLLSVALIYLLVVKTTLFSLIYKDSMNKPAIILAIVLISLTIGYSIAFAVGRLVTIPVRKIMLCFDQVALGNFNTRISLKGPFSKLRAFEDFSKSFNSMAEELQHTELVSNEFINNFSHEFKTPIVSIAGFAKLLKKENISAEQKLEYINIIEEESQRLSTMTTSILTLMRLENQEILTKITKFNLSEQIRNCLLLLDNKWETKNIDLQIDFDEYLIWGNEELLKQVWINLLDNAIKFTQEKGTIIINISKNKYDYIISISNSGSYIPEKSRERIFNKFYQADESHASQGNGIGLAVVKKIIDLHRGYIEVNCSENFTTFTIYIPL